MSKIYLTESECVHVEQLIQELPAISKQLKTSSSNIKTTINSEEISDWTNDTKIGQNIKKQLENDSYSLEQFAIHIEKLTQSINNLITDSRQNNNFK